MSLPSCGKPSSDIGRDYRERCEEQISRGSIPDPNGFKTCSNRAGGSWNIAPQHGRYVITMLGTCCTDCKQFLDGIALRVNSAITRGIIPRPVDRNRANLDEVLRTLNPASTLRNTVVGSGAVQTQK